MTATFHKQISLYDILNSQMPSKTDKQELIEKALKRGSGFERGKMRICHEYFKNPTKQEFANFLCEEYGLGGYGVGEYGANYDNKGIHLTKRNTTTRKTILQVSLNWLEVAGQIVTLIENDEYLTAQEKIEFANYQAQRYGTDEERIKATVEWIVGHGTYYSWSDYTYSNYKYGNNYQFVSANLDKIKKELMQRKEVVSVSGNEPYYLTVAFKKEYCRRKDQ